MAKICSKCKVPKNDEDFSLAIGKGSSTRKTYCKSCEYLTRNANSHGVSIDKLVEITKKPCCICKNPKSKIYTIGENKYVFCLECHNWISSLRKNHNFDSQELLNMVTLFILFPVLAEKFAVMTVEETDELKQLRLKME